MTAQTLEGVRVLDLGVRPSTAWCSRLLADFGAEVLMLEPSEGHPLRRHPPFTADGVGVAAAYFLANKRSVSGDAAAQLIENADVIVTSSAAEDGCGPQALLAANPQAIVCAITPHGLTGVLAEVPGNDLTASARSGWASVNGLEGRSPLKASGYQASYQAGTFAFGCVLCALIEQLGDNAPGQVIDIAESEVMISTFAPALLRYQYSGYVWPRKQPLDVNEGPVPVADGFFALTISRPAFWIKAMRVLGLPDLADDPELQQAGLRPRLKHRFADRLSAAMAGWKRMDLFDALGRERVIAGPVLRMNELGDNPQFAARDFFRAAPSGVKFPGPFARMSRSDWRLQREVTGVAEAPPGFTKREPITVKPVRNGDPTSVHANRGPLAGFRGLVLTQAWAGTYATELLALLGAEVIQLEVRGRLDSWRGTYQNPLPKRLQDVPTARHPWNVSPLYNSVNLNKQCITVDLSTSQGVDLFRSLVTSVDFVAENFSPRVMVNLGLNYDALCSIKPDLIMASLSAYGAIGPWADVPGIGGTIEPSSGMSGLLGYPDEQPLNSGQMYPDPVAGLCGFAAIALALLHRDRTGEGQYIDLSMQEANFTFIGDAWLDFACNGTIRGPQGNRHPAFAPHGIYPAAGEDQWLAIAIETDQQWLLLVDALKLGERLPLTDLASAEQRKAQEAPIDAAIEAATRLQDKLVLADCLARLGIPAAAVCNAAEVTSDKGLIERGHLVQVVHPEAGSMWQSGLPAIFSRTPGAVIRHAPLQGQHSFAVFERLLGMDEVTYQQLCDAQVTGQGPTTSSTVENQA